MINIRRVALGVAMGLLGMALLVVAMTARAGEAELTWQTPYTYCDNTPMATPTDIRVLWGKTQAMLPGTATAHKITGLTPGDWWFAATAIVPSEGTSPKPDESQIGGPVFKTILPEDFKTTSTTVYTFVKAEGNILVLPTLHTVPVGTVCDANQSVNGKYIIPRSAVTWSGSARPVAVLGDCG